MPEPIPEATGSTPGGVLMIALYGVLALGLFGGLSGLGLFLLAKAKDSKLVGVLQRTFEVAVSVVAYVEAHVRPDIKTALADGKLTADEVRAVQAQALAAFKAALGTKGIEDLARILNLGDGGVEGILKGFLERAFQWFKGSKAPSALNAPSVVAGLVGGVDVGRPLSPTRP